MKKLISISLSLFLIFSVFLIPASASDLSHPFFDFYSTFFGVASGREDQTLDPDDLVDYYDTNTGRFNILYNAFQLSGGNPIVTYVVKKNLDDASEHRYIAAQLKKSQLEAVFNSFEDFWASDSAPVRNLPLSDLGITFSPNVSVHGSFGKIQGSGEAVEINNSSHFTYYTYDDNVNLDSSTVYFYNGSIYFPPVMIVPANYLVYFNGYSLPPGIYYILNGSVLLFGGDRYLSTYGNKNYVRASVDGDYNCTNFYTMREGPGGGYYQYYYSSEGKRFYNSPSSVYSYNDMFNMWSKAIGIHIPIDNSYDSLINIPDDVPYDEDDETVVLVPVEGSGSPIYMTPANYNTYISNGDIYNTDDHSNNVVDNSVVNELTNLYNDYLSSLEPTSDSDSSSGSSGSGFNDGKIRAKIDRVIDKLDEILKAIKSVEPANIVQNIQNNINPEPVYVDFSDCITQNIPVADDIKNFVLSLNTNDMDSGFNDFSSILSSNTSNSSKVPNPSGTSNDSPSNDDMYSNLGVNVNWYSPYREPIRNILKVFVWGFGLIAYWHAIRSVFGIHSGGDDL